MKTFFLCLLSISLFGCISPVRHEIFLPASQLPAEAQTEEAALLKPAETERFKDTVVVNTGIPDNDLTKQMTQADELFKKKKIRQACDLYEQVSQTVAEGDSLDYEVRFMISECSSENQDFEKSLKILQALSSSEGIPDNVLEKTLVRLGQVNCVLEKKTSAAEAFTLLKKRFPKSVYLQLATCDSVK
jgi:hypothetical protein